MSDDFLSTSSEKPKINVSNITVKRLLKDIKEIIKNPLTSNGIHYIHNESDMLRGQAMIIGPSGTPYAQGYYFFSFKFPVNYPHSPPIVNYDTNDGHTRFNPNLYKCGKVCVSILNTWHGEQWTGCQTISSVLLTLCTLLNEMPLLNEPGVTKSNNECVKYNEVINYKNFEVAIIGMIENNVIKRTYAELYKMMCADFIEKYDKILLLLEERKTENKTISVQRYGTCTHIDYSIVEIGIKRIYNKLHNNNNKD